MNINEAIPCFYAAVVLYFPTETPIDKLRNALHNRCSFRQYGEFDALETIVCEVDNIACWEVEEALKLLFEKCDLEQIKSVVREYNGSVFIDISFTHGEKYPALIFDGRTMQIIHELQASIGIDPY